MSPILVSVDRREFRSAGPEQRRKLREYARRLSPEPYLGDRIQSRRVPKAFRDLPNLYRMELPGGWRALYSVVTHLDEGREVKIVWVGDHARYDRLFGY